MEARTRFSPADLTFSPLTEDDYPLLSSFTCGVESIDTFFRIQAYLCAKYKYLIPYKCCIENGNSIVGLFTLANDIIMLEHEDRNDFPNIPSEYEEIFRKQNSFPSVNIGHLAVHTHYQSQRIGRYIVEFVAETFAHHHVTGCQFITVDAINNQRILKFYNYILGFEFLTLADVGKPTRRMYLDIFTQRDPDCSVQ